MKELKVDMEMYSTGNHPVMNFVSVLYMEFEKEMDDNSRGNAENQRLAEAAFRDALVATQNMVCDGLKFGYPGAGENAFDILRRNAKTADISGVMERLVASVSKFIGFDGLSVAFVGLLDERHRRIAESVIGSCCKVSFVPHPLLNI